jgi:hypothetical protein
MNNSLSCVEIYVLHQKEIEMMNHLRIWVKNFNDNRSRILSRFLYPGNLKLDNYLNQIL